MAFFCVFKTNVIGKSTWKWQLPPAPILCDLCPAHIFILMANLTEHFTVSGRGRAKGRIQGLREWGRGFVGGIWKPKHLDSIVMYENRLLFSRHKASSSSRNFWLSITYPALGLK